MDALSMGLHDRPPARREIHRVKAGCRTCKARRVKCDEQRPSCLRCSSAGRECKGYGIWGSSGHPGRPTAQSLDLYRLGNTGPVGGLNQEDGRLLQWFMQSRVQGVFPFPFWDSLVPQACHNEPAILSCVLALGSVHRRACIDTEPTFRQSEVDSLESATLRYYNAAIRLLNGSESNVSQLGGSRASTRVTLTACLTFVIIEYLQKRPAQGLLHLQHGLQIIGSPEYNNIQQPARNPMDDWLAEAFHRLDVQAKLLFNTRADYRPYKYSQASKERPITLRSLHEARQQLDLLMSEAYRLQSKGHIAGSSTNINHLFQALIIQQRLQADLRSWLQAYRAWRTRPPPSLLHPAPSLQEQLGRRVLLAYHTMTGIITATALYQGDESVFGRYNLQFASIIALSKDAFRVARPGHSRAGPPHGYCTRDFSFTSDMGLIPVLYYTTLKCRDPQLRRDALSVIETETGQEGIWDRPTAVLIAAEVIQLEETPPPGQGEIHDKGAADGRRNSAPSYSNFPHSWRVSDVQVQLPNGPKMELVLVCRRKLGDGTWAVVERRHNGFCWY